MPPCARLAPHLSHLSCVNSCEMVVPSLIRLWFKDGSACSRAHRTVLLLGFRPENIADQKLSTSLASSTLL